MKYINKFLLLILIAGSFNGRLEAQDIHLSQFYETPLLRNPALAGIFTGDVRLQLVYRNQWNSVTIPYQTGAFSAEFKFPVGQMNDYLTVGFQTTFDQAGTSKLQSTEMMPAINYHKSLSDERSTYLSVGFMGGLEYRQFNASKMTFDNQYTNGRFDPTAPSGENFSKFNSTYPDAAVGVSFSSSFGDDINYFFGGSYFHFNRPSVSYYGDESIRLDPKWEINGGLNMPIGEKTHLVLQYNQLKQGSYSEIDGGGLIGYGLYKQGLESNMMVYGGLFLRANDAIIPVFRLDLGTYDIGLSYDVNISPLKTASRSMGGFEISFSYKGFFKSRNSTLDKLNCPHF